MRRWKEHPNNKNYLVSTEGEVYSVARIDRLGRRQGGKLLKPCRRSGRHNYVCVNIGSGLVNVHILVLETFVGPRPLGHVARHLNDVPDDNRLENLCWGSYKDNADDRRKNGGYQVAEHCKHGHAYTPENTWLSKDGWKQCKECHRTRERERKKMPTGGGRSR